MAETYLVEPDVEFIEEVKKMGGGDLKKCFQCATCSVACTIAPENKPFPRKEMIAASWGLKDRLLADGDIWLCHNCGDCTELCPRGAKPGDVLAGLRMYTISEYGKPKALAKMVPDPSKLPILLAIPAVIFIVVGLITGLLDFTPKGDEIVHANFFSTWLVDLIMIPASIFAVAVFANGLKGFINDMHQNALLEGKTKQDKIDVSGFIRSLIQVIPTILKHDKFSDCNANRDRSTSHMMVLFGFIGLFIVTSVFFVYLYIFQIHGPYSQLNPVKWLANVSGIALIIGSALMIKNRLEKTDQLSTYKDWQLIGLALALGLTGMVTEITRLAGWGAISYTMYFIHMIFVFALFVYLPFTKLAHLVYRTVAMAYNQYAERK